MSLLAFGFKRKGAEGEGGEGEGSANKKAKADSQTKPVSLSPTPLPTTTTTATTTATSKTTTTAPSAAKTTTSSTAMTSKGTDSEAPPDSAVVSLLSSLTEPGWLEALSKATSSKQFKNLAQMITSERKRYTIYPPPSEVFSAFTLTPFQNVKAVVIGQDPYHGPGQGHGLSFSVKPGVKVPPSLRNIYKHLHQTGLITKIPNHGDLTSWASQGVFMLNVTLTVRQGSPNSHETKKKLGDSGWSHFTSRVLKALSSTRTGLVFFGWGKNAEAAIKANVDTSKHLAIHSSHPSPLGATKTARAFMSSDCFNKCNEYLGEGNAIDWNSVNTA